MNPSEQNPEPAPDAPAPANGSGEGTGLPGFRTWPAVYVLVLVCFAVGVVLLAAFTHVYSR